MKKTRTLFLVLAIILTFTFATPVVAQAKSVTITCQMDASYRSEYSSYVSNMTSTMTNVGYPFNNKWSITFSKTYMDINNLAIDSCTRSYGTACAVGSPCGTTCVNTSSSSNHHKNMYRNYHQVINDIPITGYKLMLTVSASNMCYQSGGSHSDGILGLGATSGDYSFVKNNTTRGMMLNVRVIQHELSHNFGCNDGPCTSGSNCIMSGGFDNNSSYNLTTIWCSNCTSKFNSSLH